MDKDISILLRKHYLVLKRKVFLFWFVWLLPLFLFFCLFFIEYKISDIYTIYKHRIFDKIDVNKIDKCYKPKDCVSLGVFILTDKEEPNNNFNKIINRLAINNDFVLGKDIKILKKSNNFTDFHDYIFENKNKTQIALIFCDYQFSIYKNINIPCKFDKHDKELINYNIYLNLTYGFSNTFLKGWGSPYPINEIALKVKKSVDEAIIQEFTNKDFKMNITYQSYPSSLPRFYEGYSFFTNIGSFFLFLPISITFLLILNEIITEKDKFQNQFLYLQGVSKYSYWISYVLFAIILNLYNTIFTYLMTFIFKFELFKNIPSVYWISFIFLNGFAFSMLSIIISNISKDKKVGYALGYSLLLMSYIFQIFFTNPNTLKIFFKKNNNGILNFVKFVLNYYPGFNFIKIWSDFVNYSGTHYDFTNNKYVEGQIYNYEQFQKKIEVTLPMSQIEVSIESCMTSYINLIRNIILFVVTLFILEFFNKNKKNYSFKRLLFKYLRKLIFRKKNLISNFRSDFQKESVNNEENEIKNIDEYRNLLVIKNLFVSYNENNYIINDISFKLEKGEILTILGKNGAGKTTLINTLSGILEEDSGEIFYFKKSKENNVNKLISIVPQFDIYWEDLTVLEHLDLFCNIKNVLNKKIINDILDNLNLYQKKDHKISTLSGGMKRRLSLAISCIGNPKIIFLDEPTTGLDPINQKLIINQVKELKKDKIIILTSHLMDEVEELSDKIIILKEGRILSVGNSNDIKIECKSTVNKFVIKKFNQILFENRKLIKNKLNMFELSEINGNLEIGLKNNQSEEEWINKIINLNDKIELNWEYTSWNLEDIFINELY